jgi:hypothetical protein
VRWVLNLGDARDERYQLRAICWAETREALERLIAAEAVERCLRKVAEREVRCYFREGGPLEWCMPPWAADDRHFVEVPELKDYLVSCGRDYRERFEKLRRVE